MRSWLPCTACCAQLGLDVSLGIQSAKLTAGIKQTKLSMKKLYDGFITLWNDKRIPICFGCPFDVSLV